MSRPFLTLRFRRVSPTHHKIGYVRRDASSEEAVVETRSLLTHDFLHFALESEANCMNGFYGLVGKGYSYRQLAGKEPALSPPAETEAVERVVGALTAVVKGASPSDAMSGLQGLFDAHGEELPAWLTLDLISRASDRFRRILSQWNSLRFGEVLELVFDPKGELIQDS